MALELEKWRRFSELFIIYDLSKEHGIQIPGAWELNSNLTQNLSDTSATMSRTSSSEVEVLRRIDTNFTNSIFLPSDIASPD